MEKNSIRTWGLDIKITPRRFYEQIAVVIIASLVLAFTVMFDGNAMGTVNRNVSHRGIIALFAGFLLMSIVIMYRESLFLVGIAVTVASGISLLSRKETSENLYVPQLLQQQALPTVLVYAD